MRTMLVAIDGLDVALRALEQAARQASVMRGILDGDLGETTARRAAELGCDSIVTGTHGRGRLGSALIGSVAQRVAHDASVPVTPVK